MGLSLTGEKCNLLFAAAVDDLADQKIVIDDILLYAKDFKEHVGKGKKIIATFLRPRSFGKQVKIPFC